MNFDALKGKSVIGSGGYIIGEIKGASIDIKSWQVTHLHVKLTNTAAEELGFKKRFLSSTVCMPTNMVLAVADVVNIAPPLKELSESNEITECKE